MIVELAPASREEFFAEAAHVPDTPEERAAQQAKFRAWRQDPRFERFWPSLDRYLEEDTQPQQCNGKADGGAECSAGVAGKREEEIESFRGGART